MAIIKANNNTLSSVTALPFATGGLVKLNTTTVSSATANVDFNNTLITDTYKVYFIHFHSLAPVTDAQTFTGELSYNNGSNFTTGSYEYHYHYGRNGSTDTGSGGTGQSNNFNSSWAQSNTSRTGYEAKGVYRFDGLRNSSVHTTIQREVIFKNHSNNRYFATESWYLDNTSTHDFIRLKYASGNIATGTFILYGLAE
tara:strand:- start:212 stop:805 length:594 start_codon:yes stop_codon:yes gene_type:complete